MKNKKYSIVITETLKKVVSVEASSLAEAVRIVDGQYRNSDIVLIADDFAGYEIKGAE
jgi:hypothetical protein